MSCLDEMIMSVFDEEPKKSAQGNLSKITSVRDAVQGDSSREKCHDAMQCSARKLHFQFDRLTGKAVAIHHTTACKPQLF